jgi:hypothetical protein
VVVHISLYQGDGNSIPPTLLDEKREGGNVRNNLHSTRGRYRDNPLITSDSCDKGFAARSITLSVSGASRVPILVVVLQYMAQDIHILRLLHVTGPYMHINEEAGRSQKRASESRHGEQI